MQNLTVKVIGTDWNSLYKKGYRVVSYENGFATIEKRNKFKECVSRGKDSISNWRAKYLK